MRSLLYSLALVVAVGVAVLTPDTASARPPRVWVSAGYGPGYYYAPSYYYTPTYTTPYVSSYYEPATTVTSYYEPSVAVTPAYTYTPAYTTYYSGPAVYGGVYFGGGRYRRWR